ncbi:MAG: hypothetical protein GXP35_16775 [Actinobacteria bacterium]|nr:hypothetical protein [Actinomycetota bacterium]
MPSLRTEITEVVTGLGMMGFDSVERALVHRPDVLVDVSMETWDRIAAAADDPQFRADVFGAWRNGQVFFQSDDGLRRRRPMIIEWKGGHRAPGGESVPVDLRVDHVFLISCKYASKILLNSAPAQLFDGTPVVGDWYDSVAPDQHQVLYAAARRQVGNNELPAFVTDLARHHRQALKPGLDEWSAECVEAYRELSLEVGRVSAARWRAAISTKRQQEAMLWRLLRISSAPYFILGSSGNRTLRVRVTTPWDWRRRFEFRDFECWGEDAGQPRVGWRASVRDHLDGTDSSVDGHVEIRWSHGRFGQSPEAKVYLDTPHDRVPGYLPLA